MISVAPPGTNGTMARMGLIGYACPHAAPAAHSGNSHDIDLFNINIYLHIDSLIRCGAREAPLTPHCTPRATQ